MEASLYMRRARVVGALAVAAGLVAVPAALAVPGHHPHIHPPVKVRYDVTGLSGATLTSTSTALPLTGVKYHPASLATASPLPSTGVVLGTTKYANRHGKPIAEASIKAGDRIEVRWVEPGGSTASTSLPATEVIDLGPPPPIRYDVTGLSGATLTSTSTALPLTGVKYHPASLATASPLPSTGVVLGTTKYANRHGKPIAEASIKAGDRIEVRWVEPGGSTASTSLPATEVIDLGPPPPIRYDVTGLSGATLTSTSTALPLTGVKYHPASLATASPLPSTGVVLGTTKYANRHGKPIAEASIKAGDRIEVRWVEPGGSTASTSLPATEVIDLSIR